MDPIKLFLLQATYFSSIRIIIIGPTHLYFASKSNEIKPDEAFQLTLLSNNHDRQPENRLTKLTNIDIVTEEDRLSWHFFDELVLVQRPLLTNWFQSNAPF